MTRLKNGLNRIKENIIDTLVFIAGGVLCSIDINLFTARNGIPDGGFTGIAILLNHLFELPIGTVIFALNLPLFIISAKKTGLAFVLRTAWATLIMSALIDIGTLLPVYEGDLLLCSVFGGVLSGAGLGIIFIRNATTGGVDIIAKLVGMKKPHISPGRVILIFDLAVVTLGGFVYRSLESVLYAMVVIFVTSQTLDYIIFGKTRSATIFIITESGDSIRDMLISRLHRGVTVLNGYGGYSNNKKQVLLCACYYNQSSRLIKEIKSADPKAFFIVTQSKQIFGEGFMR